VSDSGITADAIQRKFCEVNGLTIGQPAAPAVQERPPEWDHVRQAFVDGAREQRNNFDMDEATLSRVSGSYWWHVFGKVNSVSGAPAPSAAPAVQEPQTGLTEMGWIMESGTKGELAAYDQGCEECNHAVTRILDGKDNGHGVMREPTETLRRRLLELVRAPAPLAAPAVQEPVAWMTIDGEDVMLAVNKVLMVQATLGRWASAAAQYTVPLYRAPAPLAAPAVQEPVAWRWWDLNCWCFDSIRPNITPAQIQSHMTEPEPLYAAPGAAPSAAPAVSTSYQFWLIERGSNQGQSPTLWWSDKPDAVGSYSWVGSVHEAKQFTTQTAAQDAADANYVTDYAITSHGWISRHAAPGAASPVSKEPVAFKPEDALDAARYRWLRDKPWSDDLHRVITLHQNALFDTAIDAAMKEPNA
jgi:hypothetical protein